MSSLSSRAVPPQAWKGCDILVVSPTPTHPQDHGNRKRIYEVCAELKRQGARIHFVHYAAEHDWRNDRPRGPEREMIATWDSYQLIAPSRPVHQASARDDHLIDEWADPDIGHYISWVCRTQSIDAVIVNYTWMSFCFDYVPNGIFKICDTHDAFGGRRAMLERNGIAAEFFHTTESEEARGLARADLVWAIKVSEQQYFEQQLSLRNCLTLLHAEPVHSWWLGPPSEDGWLRAGVIGARNNVNRRNLERFLRVALPIIESYMAPVKIIIAGSCADDFKNLPHPNVEVFGRVPDLADFYRAVDVVIAPMEFSTGLKIKVSEALASGAPLIALGHATEGYPTAEPLHLVPDFETMALELVKLAFDPAPLPALADCSRTICADIRASVLAGLEETRQRLIAYRNNSLCIVLPMAALDPHMLLYDHLVSAVDYFRFMMRLNLYVLGPPANPDPDLFVEFKHQIKIFAAPQLMAELGAKSPENWTAMPFAELVETWGVWQAYFLCDDKINIRTGVGMLSQVIVRHDAMEFAGGDPAELIKAVSGSARVIVVGSRLDRLSAWRAHYGVEGVVQVGFRRMGRFQSLEVAEQQKVPLSFIVLGKRSDPLSEQVLRLGMTLGSRGIIIDLEAASGAGREAVPEEALVALTGARLVVDLTQYSSLAAVLDEAAQRADIPVIRLLRGRAAAVLHSGTSQLFATSIGALLRTVARGLCDPAYYELLYKISRQDLSSRSAADAGWTWLWHHLKGASEAIDPATSIERLFS